MIALLTACLFFEILVHVLNCIGESARLKTVFGHLNFASKFTHSCGVSERREVKGERQVMLPLVLLIIFQVSFSFNLLFTNLFTNWRLSPEFWSPNIFSTRHGDQNGRSLECCRCCI